MYLMTDICRKHFYNLLDSEKEELLWELQYFHQGANNFTAILMKLINKSDFQNRMKLFNEYPNEVTIVHLWQNCTETLNPDYTWNKR
jgi:hypothetical protein